MKNNGMVVPIEQEQGEWLSPDRAAPYFRNGRGISVSTLMNKIYSGELNGRVRRNHLGWFVLIPHSFKTTPLKAA